VRGAFAVLGALLALVGVVWLGQGLGYIRGSFMTGSHLWAAIGALCLALGAALIYNAVRPPRNRLS
jgi:hypothetical protein